MGLERLRHGTWGGWERKATLFAKPSRRVEPRLLAYRVGRQALAEFLQLLTLVRYRAVGCREDGVAFSVMVMASPPGS